MTSTPYHAMIDMARSIARSGLTGTKTSKAEAESTVREVLGPSGQLFADRNGSEYWAYLKGVLSRYVVYRNLEEAMVVKGTPFHWHASVGTKCSAVILRKDFHRGDTHVEPELYLEVGLLDYGAPVFGAACGFHYLPSPEGDSSRFVRHVMDDPSTRSMAWALSNDGFLKPSSDILGPDRWWGMDTVLAKAWSAERLPDDLELQVFRALDELLPLFKGIIAAP